MAVEWIVQKAPLWIVLLLLFGVMALACECGVWIHDRMRRKGGDGVDREAEGYVLSGVLGLLALLVAFTFGMSLSRYDVRRELVIKEANALSTAWMRTAFLDDPGRLRDLMRQYADARLQFGVTYGDKEREADEAAVRLQPLIWAEAVRLVGPARQTPFAAFMLDPLNEAFDTATARRAALAARLPGRVLWILVVYMIATAAVLGFAVAGASGRLRIASFALFALFALALGVILDLDEPRRGPIHVPQGAMADAVHLMATGQPLPLEVP
jgi:hypothetical protein